MEITSTTTLEELLNEGLIGKRTFNVLQSINIDNISSLNRYLFEGNDLDELSNFGKKCKFEINNVLAQLKTNVEISTGKIEEEKFKILSKVEKECFQKAIADVPVTQDDKVANYIKECYPEPCYMFYKLFYDHDEILYVTPSFSMEENILFRKYTVSVLEKFINKLLVYTERSNMSIVGKADNILSKLKSQITYFSCQEIYAHFLSDSRKEYIRELFERTYKLELSSRALNFRDQYLNNFEDVLKLVDTPSLQQFNTCFFHKYSKLRDEIIAVNQKLKYRFLETAMMGEVDFKLYDIKQKYPFLSDEQVKFVENYTSQNNREPYFFLLLNYLKTSNEKEDVCYCLCYGMNDNIQRSNADVGEILHRSRERIRQLVHSNKVAEKFIISSDIDKLKYDILNKTYIYSSDTEIENIIETENLGCNFTVFAYLLVLISDYKIFSFNGTDLFLAKKAFFENVNLDEIISNFNQYSNSKYEEDTIVNIKDVIGEIPTEYEKDTHNLIKDVINSNSEEITISNDDLIFHKNTVNIELELYKILKEQGSPLDKDNLLTLFKQKNPDHYNTTVKQIKNQIQTSSRIKSIGVSGLYGLAEWDDVFYGSIRDLAYCVLDQSDEPMEVSDILDEVIKHYPNTNIKSLLSSIETDKSGRFICIRKGLIGLAGKDYVADNNSSLTLYTCCTESFSERLQKYCSFIEKHKRIPCSSNDSEETSLYRWAEDVELGILVVTNEEYRIFKEVRNKYLS